MTGLTRQAKVLSEAQIRAALAEVSSRPTADRDRAMLLISVKAGLRAKEIASITWAMVTHADSTLANEISLTNEASKVRHGGRNVPMHNDLREALGALHAKQ